MRTLLLTTTGGMVAALLLPVLAPWRSRIRIVGLNAEPTAMANFACDTTYLVPRSEDPAWAVRVAEILEAERPDLVLPTRDGDLVPLARLAAARRFPGTLVFAPGPVTAAMVTDKRASFAFAQAHGLPFAETAATPAEVEALIGRAGFPLIVKPRRGTGAEGVRIVRSWDEVRAQIARADPVFQPYLDDPAILDLPILDPSLGMPFLIAYGGRRNLSAVGAVLPDRRVLTCGTLGLRFDGPTTSLAHRVDDPRMEAMTRALGAALAGTDFLGLFNLQAVAATDGTLVPIEYNGRLVGAAQSRTALGISEVPVILHLLLGEALPPMPQAPVAGYTVTALHSTLVAAADAAALERERVWHRPPGTA